MNYRHFVLHSQTICPSNERAEVLERIFGAVRTFHNSIIGHMEGVSQTQLCYGLNDQLDAVGKYSSNHRAEAFKASYIYRSDIKQGTGEIIAQAHPAILESHVSVIANSWAEYSVGRRRRPSFKDRTSSQSFWVTEKNGISMENAWGLEDMPILHLPAVDGKDALFIAMLDSIDPTYELTTFRLTKSHGNYYLNVLFEKEMTLEEVTAIHEKENLAKGHILIKWGAEISEDLFKIANPLSPDQNEPFRLKDNIARIRRHVLNRLSKRRELITFPSPSAVETSLASV